MNHKSPGRKRLGRYALSMLAAVVAILLGWGAAVAAFFGAGFVSAAIPVLLGAAVFGCFVVFWVMVRLIAGFMRFPRARWVATGAAAVGTAALLLVASFTVLRPLPSTPEARRSMEPPAQTQYWTLATGSTVAVLEIPTGGPPRSVPIVVVGGGPGEGNVADRSLTGFFERFAALGYDVYFYDQVGSGLSERLSNPAEYTVARHVADLEELRQRIATDRMILLGSSWGGSLVASYMARHPARVDRAIFTSPAPIDYAQWRDVDTGSPSSRLPPQRRQEADALLPGSPRFILWYLLGGINPRAAYNLISDREADSYFSTYLHLVAPAMVCDPANVPTDSTTGYGFYDNVFTVRDARSGEQAQVREALTHDPTPSLILTGPCNYVPWEVTRQYRTTLSNSTLVCLPNSGHVIYLDQPTPYFDTIRSFLLDQPLPIPPWTSTQPC